MRPSSQRLAWLRAAMWYTWEKSAIGWPLPRRKAFTFGWLSCLGFFACLRPLADESASLTRARSHPSAAQTWRVPLGWSAPSRNKMRLLALCRSLFSLEADGYCSFQYSSGVPRWTAWPWLLGLPKYCQKYFLLLLILQKDKRRVAEEMQWSNNGTDISGSSHLKSFRAQTRQSRDT